MNSEKWKVKSFNITVQGPLSVIRSIRNIDMPVTGYYHSVQVKFDTLRLSDAGQYTCLVAVTDSNNNTAIIKGTNTIIG